jgi:RNA polymerase sigma-70 factor (ECF subfamily)
MSRRSVAYLAALREPGADPPLDPSELERTLTQLHAQGAAAHPELTVPEAAFAQHLARCGARLAAPAGELHAADLYLACAALSGNASALDRLKAEVQPAIERYLRPLGVARSALDEVRQRAWELLLVGDAERPPRLVVYSGRGRLHAFVGVTAQRIAFHQARHTAAEKRALEKAADLLGVQIDPELAVIKEHYRDLFQEAVDQAVRVLDDHERMIVRMQVVDGLALDEIANVYRVSQSTVSRRLAKARAKVTAQCRRLLRERVQLSTQEFESIFHLLMSQLHVSVSRVFGRTD